MDRIPPDQMAEFNNELAKIAPDTFSCWLATRLNDSRAQDLAEKGNISTTLLGIFDELGREVIEQKVPGNTIEITISGMMDPEDLKKELTRVLKTV